MLFFSKNYFKKWTGSFNAAKVGAEITTLLSQPPHSAGITGTQHGGLVSHPCGMTKMRKATQFSTLLILSRP